MIQENLYNTKSFLQKKNAEDIKPAVEKWLNKVDEFVGKSKDILAKEGEHGRLCSTNLVQRYKLSRKASKMTDEVLEMKNEGDNFDSISFKGIISLVETSRLKAPYFQDFDSRKLIMEQIMDALSNDNNHRIGVCGMGGVGKTTMVKEILRKMIENKTFDEVVISSIGQTPDVKIIQGQFADMLGLKFDQETKEGRASMLRKRLKKEKSILVVLDDVWNTIDLDEIGIPSSVEDHIGCKILFTSRDYHLISNEFRVDECFEIQALGENESWSLFKEMVGESVETSDLKPIAIQIVGKCAGLPIAIATVASALRNKSLFNWKVALDELKRKDMVVSIRGMDKSVYSSLQLSYDFLGNEEVKLLFLLCSMFPEDFDIDVEELQIYAMSIGFLHGVQTIAQGRRRIAKLVDDLISSSLLLQSKPGRNDLVKMHDMVRDVAIYIASKNAHIRTLCYVKKSNEEWEETKLSGNYTAVSLVVEDSDNQDHIPKLMFPEVQLLLLSTTSIFGGHRVLIVKSFYEEMKKLKGLVLKSLKIPSLPPSICSLTNIRLLSLNSCKLGSMDMIGKLKMLEILDLSRSIIVEIPTTFSQLTQLKVLNLSNCYPLWTIAPNILSKLTKLEELKLDTFDRWEEKDWPFGKKNASVSVLRYLPHLYILNLTIKDEKIMPKNLFSTGLNLEKFNITIGSDRKTKEYFDSKHRLLRKLDLNMKSEKYFDDWIKMLLARSEGVCLQGSICSKALQWELLDNANDFNHLKYLHLSNNSEFQHIIHENINVKPLRKCLSNLEYLHLNHLENLKTIIHGYARDQAPFMNLEHIEISSCENMEALMNFTLMENEESTNNDNYIQFTHLKSIVLRQLPRLQKFCFKFTTTTTTISNDDIINGSFFIQQVSLPNLEKLTIDGADNLKKMIWSNNLVIPNNDSFSKLKEINIISCNNLRNVFSSPNMISILTCLNILFIKDCELLEGIFLEVKDQAIGVTETSPIALQKLAHLRLINLPNLEYIWSNINDHPSDRLLSFPNIKSWTIQNCPNLKGREHYLSSQSKL